MAQYPQVSFAEKRNLIFTVCKINPSDVPNDTPQRTIMMMPSVAIDEYELFFSDSHPSYIIWIGFFYGFPAIRTIRMCY